jgi:hypothetical protein
LFAISGMLIVFFISISLSLSGTFLCVFGMLLYCISLYKYVMARLRWLFILSSSIVYYDRWMLVVINGNSSWCRS